jgi:hypothetical protein
MHTSLMRVRENSRSQQLCYINIWHVSRGWMIKEVQEVGLYYQDTQSVSSLNGEARHDKMT